MNDTYYGNAHGLVLGPYADDEMRARLLAKQRLEQQGDVYAVRARDFKDAKARIDRAARESRAADQR